MKLLASILALLLVQAGHPPRAEERGVPLGARRSWSPQHGSWSFTSAGVRVRFAPLPCPQGRDEACDRGFSGHARVTVAAPGLAPFTFDTPDQGMTFSAAVVRFDKRDARSGLIVGSDSGGSAGIAAYRVALPRGKTFVLADVIRPRRGRSGETALLGPLADVRDIDGDGRIDFVLRDGDFDGAYDCHACTWSPPLVLSLAGTRTLDISRRPGVRSIFASDMAKARAKCLSSQPGRNGRCITYAADAARLGRFATAWREIAAHYERGAGDRWYGCDAHAPEPARCPAKAMRGDFPAMLRWFLRNRGYIG